ncbi:PREDICTED: F-box only protein 48 [Nanorana parkeri]|uniref:F-box only protein 48 n=1 Tax=Nanorana parkeri TaxID=125878 RepID=UPI000854079F|nr:PREDICTED: F-box only protein 48 [Nanorana parkeri]
MENTSSQRDEFSAAQGNEDNCFNIPDEFLSEILSNLDVKSLCQINQTCKASNELLENNDLLWRRHCLALRSVCQSEVDEDREKGFTCQETLRRNYSKRVIKQQWLDGRFSNISSYSELPQNSMCPLSVKSWGEIMEAEFRRETRQ